MTDPGAPLSALPPTFFPDPDELLSSVLAISLTGIIIFTPIYGTENEDIIDFNFLFLNPAGQRMLNLPERPGTTLLKKYPYSHAGGVLSFYRQVFISGVPGQFNLNYQNDGLDNYFCLSAQRSGKHLVVSFTDTADHSRSEVEQALRESQAREKAARADADLQREQLHSIFMQAPALICIFEGPDHTFKLVNPRYQQLVGDREILNKPIAEAMPELRGQPIFDLLNKVYRTGESYYAQEMLVQLDHTNSGSELGENFYNFIYQAIRNLDGNIEGILVFAYEVTAQVKARQQIEYGHQKVHALVEELETRVTERTLALQQAQAEAEIQKQRLERLFMQAPAGICILNGPDLIFELVNQGYQQLFPGRSLLGKSVLDALPELADQPILSLLRNVYTSGETYEGKELLVPLARHENGPIENLYFNFIYQARHNQYGQVDGIMIFVFEVTDQVLARQNIEANAQQLKLITDALPVLVSYVDKEEKYRFVNKAYETWFNQKPELLIGKTLQEVIGEKAYQQVAGYVKRALAGERLDFEARMPYREDFIRHIRTSFVPNIQAGEVVGYYAMIHDVTEQVEAGKALKESEQQAKSLALDLALANQDLGLINQQLTRSNIDLDNFIYTASHDLKAPILNIEGLMDALFDQIPAENLASPLVKRTTDLILDSVQRFKRTIDHLTEITKLQKENSYDNSPIELAVLISDVKLDMAPAIALAQATIELDIELCPKIRFSEKHLRSIIFNLLSNAIKYRSPERPPLVRISCRENDHYFILCVQDNGLGIDLNLKHKLFAMFKRLHNHVEGSGIGLYMVNRILENAGGKIEVQSKIGEGSIFQVYIKKNAT